jgi:hypothetical protein
MTLPLAHAGHILVDLLYVAPLLVVLGALGWSSLRDRRRGGPPEPRRDPSSDDSAG